MLTAEAAIVFTTIHKRQSYFLEAAISPNVYRAAATPPTSRFFLFLDPRSIKYHTMSGSTDPEREHALEEYKTKLLDSRGWEAKLKALRLEIKGLQHDFDVSEENIKALQSVGQIIGEVLKQLDEERCELKTGQLKDALVDSNTKP